MSVGEIQPQLVLVSSHESTKLDEMTQMRGGHMLSWSHSQGVRAFWTKVHCDLLNSTFTSLNTQEG